MESLSDTKWDVVISGTGLQQSLLALALSRSGKKILHVDPNDYYGGPEAAFSLQEADEFAEKHRAKGNGRLFEAAEVKREAEGLSFPRSYSLALAPTLIYSRSKLLSQLVDSKAFRQLEFLAVGSFYIYQPSPSPALSRIPSTREDVFSNTVIPARSKRSLMKFLKFVLDFDSEPQTETWQAHADQPLSEFLASTFKLDSELQSYISTLTLSIDGKVSVKDGLTSINRHLTSIGVFGRGFAAVYPKWGGLSEVAQVGCRAAAVGGAVYMLGSGVKEVVKTQANEDDQVENELEVKLTNDMEVKAKLLVQGSEDATTQTEEATHLSRLTAVVKSDMASAFEGVADGSPTPAVGVVAFPPGSLTSGDGTPSVSPIYAMVHSSDTGECPVGQCVVYFSTICGPSSKLLLQKALSALLLAISSDGGSALCLYQLYYEQRFSAASLTVDGNVLTFSPTSPDPTFNDSVLEPVREVWNSIISSSAQDEEVEYMKFEDREGAADEDEIYE